MESIGKVLGNIGQIFGKYWAKLGNIGQILATLYLFCCCLDFESQLHFQHLKLVYSTLGLLFSTFHMNHDEFGQSLENSASRCTSSSRRCTSPPPSAAVILTPPLPYTPSSKKLNSDKISCQGHRSTH